MADNDEIIIEVNNLTFEYLPKQIVLNDVSFKIKEGEKVLILGENGSGKSTLFHCLLYLVPKFKGEIKFYGKKITKKNAKEIRKKVSILFQNPDDHLFLPTVKEELNFAPYNLGLRDNSLKKRVNATIEELKLQKFMDKKTFHLSFGEKRRVSFGTIHVMDPDVYILDEPFVSLDPENRNFLTKELEKIGENNKTILMISHELEQIPTLFERAIVLHEGKLIYDGSIPDLYNKSEILEKANLRLPVLPKLFNELKNLGFIKINENQRLPNNVEDALKVLKKSILKNL